MNTTTLNLNIGKVYKSIDDEKMREITNKAIAAYPEVNIEGLKTETYLKIRHLLIVKYEMHLASNAFMSVGNFVMARMANLCWNHILDKLQDAADWTTFTFPDQWR